MALGHDENQGKGGKVNVLTAYIVKEVLKGSLIALLLLLTLFNLFTFSDELKSLGVGKYDLKDIFLYLALTSPRVFYELIPSSALLGSLFILGAMGNNRELIAMRAAGLSTLGIIKAVLWAGVLLVMISILVGEFIAPYTERAAQLLKTTAKNERVAMDARYGVWMREGKSFINIREIKEDGSLANIFIYDLDDHSRLRQSLSAAKASYLGRQQWKLEQIRQSRISTEKMIATEHTEQLWTSSIAPDLLKIVVVNPDNLSLYDLALYIEFLKGNHQKSQSYELAFWGRVVNPLVTFVMLLVAAPFVIGVKRGVSTGARMMIGVIIGMSFNILDKIVGHMGLVYDLNPPLMAVSSSLTVLVLALWAIKRTH
jgi:lipopolysaccharide export system permease protein